MYFCRRRAATQATQTTQNTQTASQQVAQQATQTTQTVAQQATQTASQTAARQAVRTVSQTQRLSNWVILVTEILDLSDCLCSLVSLVFRPSLLARPGLGVLPFQVSHVVQTLSLAPLALLRFA